MNPFKVIVPAVVSLASASFAAGATTVPQFDAAVATARTTSSPGGAAVTRDELRGAIDFFLADDSSVDAVERAHLSSSLANSSWRIGVNGSALKYGADFVELNDGGPVAPLNVYGVSQTPLELFGAAGAMTNAAWVQEGFIPNGQGVTNQQTLQDAYAAAFQAGASTFKPINNRELLEKLSANVDFGTPSKDELDGAMATIVQISRNSNRLYLASWHTPGRFQPGDLGGYVVAAVSSDRRFVRFVEIRTWSE